MESEAKIYKITNMVNHYIYIGSTMKEHIEDRLKEHFKSAKDNNETNLMYEDMRNQPKSDFFIELIDTCAERHRFIIEAYYTDKAFAEGYSVYNKKLGNNLDRNTIQRIATARKELLIDNPEYYQSEEFKAKSMRLGKQNGMYGKKGADAINGRAVYMLDDNMQLVKTFPSVTEAKAYLGIKAHTALNKACREGLKYHGYYWRKEWVNNRKCND